MITKLLKSVGFLTIGLVIGVTIGQYQPNLVQAINVVGSEVINGGKADSIFRVIISVGNIIETDSGEAISDITKHKVSLGEAVDELFAERLSGTEIGEEASANLQFLANFHQSLADLQAQFPCPGVECDPDIETDPARCSLFWEDLDPQIDHPIIPGEGADTLTGRNVIIGVNWNETVYFISLRDPSTNPANFPDNC